MQYIIYCDESEKNGKFFGNFYGGALVRSIHFHEVKDALAAKKVELGFSGEVKWQKLLQIILKSIWSL